MNLVNKVSFRLRSCLQVIAGSSLLAGCSLFAPQATAIKNCDIPDIKDTKAINVSPVTIQVYVDATPSMSGYVAVSESEYIKSIRLVDRAAVGFSAKKEYFAFGEKALPSNSTTEFVNNAQKMNFYDRDDPALRNTRLANIIPDAGLNKDEKLIVAITDLYEDKAIVTAVNAKLNGYIKNGYAIGVVGVKSKFKGTIYDVDGVGSELRYPEDEAAAPKIRPFYILLIGSYENVNKYFGYLESKDKKIFDSNNFSIFYSQPVQSVGQLVGLSTLPKPSQGFSRPVIKGGQVTLNEGGSLVEINGSNIEILRVPRAIKNNLEINYQASYTPIDKVADSLTLATNIASYELFTTNAKEFKPQDTTNFSALSLTKLSASPESRLINFTANIEPSKLDQGVSFVTVDIKVSDDNKSNNQTQWWNSWSADIGSRDGSKTINLAPFLGDLQFNSKQGMKKKLVARLCYVVHKQ